MSTPTLDVRTRESIACESADLLIAAETLATCDEDGNTITAATARLMVRVIERALVQVKFHIDAADS